MIKVKYGLLPRENFCRYFDFLINRIFKILPMKEDGLDTLLSYMEGLQRELIGNKHLFKDLVNEPKFISILSSIQFLIDEDYSNEVCRKEVFKCIHLLDELKKKYGV